MSWVFEGVLLPVGELARVALGEPTSGRAERLPGRFALPGLVDAHAHLTVRDDHTLGGEDLAGRRLAACAAAGVSTVRDVGGRSSVTLRLAASPAPGVPRVLAAGRFLAPAGRYFPGMHEPVAAPDLPAAAAREIDAGATWLKLIGDFPRLDDGRPVPGSLAPTYDAATVREVVALAHDRGARVAVHTQSRHADALVAAGADSVEHGEWLGEEAVAALGARGGAWTPTLAAVTDPPAGSSPARLAYAAEASERMRTLLPRALAAGVQVLAGTDNAASLAHELALLMRHGLTPEQALAAGSTGSAWLEQDEPALDSLLTYDADPREHPEVLAEPTAVVTRGCRTR